MVQRLAYVMQEPGSLGNSGVKPQLGGNHAREVSHLQRVVEHILPIARTVAQPAQKLHQLMVHAVYAHLQNGPLALLLDGGLHLAAGLINSLLNPCGMYAPVGDKLLQGDPGNLTAHRLKA